MNKTIAFLALAFSFSAIAIAETTEVVSSIPNSFYLKANKSVVAITEAMRLSSSEDVYFCQPMEIKVSKSGKGMSFKVRKAKKITE